MAKKKDILELISEAPTGLAQSLVTLGTASGADVVSGLQGIGDIIRGRSLSDAAANIERTQDMLTVMPPEGSPGETYLQKLGELLEPIDRLAQSGYDQAFRFGGPLAATGAQTLVEGGVGSLVPLSIGRGAQSVIRNVENQDPSGIGEALVQASMMQNPATQTQIFTGERSNLMLAPEIKEKFERAREIRDDPANTPEYATTQQKKDEILERKVFKETGLSIGADGLTRFEIADDQARLKIDPSRLTRQTRGQAFASGAFGLPVEVAKGNIFKASDVIDHPLLFQAYPQMKDFSVELQVPPKTDNPIDGSDVGSGSFNPVTNTVSVIADNPDTMKSILLHELQHAAQEIENFNVGGNVRSARNLARFAAQDAVDKAERAFERAAEKIRQNPRNRKNERDKFYETQMDFIASEQAKARTNLRAITKFQDIIRYENIPAPRFLFNTGEYYKYQSEIARQLGRMPSRNPKKRQWIEDAGQIIANRKIDELIKDGELVSADELIKQLNEYRRNPQELKKAVRRAEYRYTKYHTGELADLLREVERARDKLSETQLELRTSDPADDIRRYERLAGEVEARNVQNRMKMTPEERLALPPRKTEAYSGLTMQSRGGLVPRENQIVVKTGDVKRMPL